MTFLEIIDDALQDWKQQATPGMSQAVKVAEALRDCAAAQQKQLNQLRAMVAGVPARLAALERGMAAQP